MGGAEADTNTEDEGKEAAVKTEAAPAAAVVVTSNEETAAVAPPAALNGADLLSKDMKEAAKGGLTHFTKMNGKILELVSQNHTLLLERVREGEEGCQKQLKEKDEQIKKLQNLLTNKDEHMKKLTSKISAGSEFDEKAKKFFGENEDFYKKKVEEVTKANKELAAKLGESEARRMENLLEEADSTKIRETVTSLAGITEDIQSKTEQVWAVVQGMDSGVLPTGDGEKSRDQTASSTMGLLHNKVDKMIRLMVETSENQKKMNKVLQDLLKSGFVEAETGVVSVTEEKEKEKERDRDRERERDRDRERDERDDRKRKRRDREESSGSR